MGLREDLRVRGGEGKVYGEKPQHERWWWCRQNHMYQDSIIRTYVCSSAVSVDLTLSATLQSLYCTIVYACVCVRVGSMLVLAAVLIWCVCVCMRACWKHAGVGRCVDMVCMRVWSVQVSGSV